MIKKKKTIQKLGIEGTYFNITKIMYEKPTANVILNREKLKAFSFLSKIKNKTFTTIIQHRVRSPSYSNQKKKKRNPNWERKLSSFADDMMIYV